MMCEQLNISRSRFYDWVRNPIGKRQAANTKLVSDIRQIFEGSNRIYGSPRIQAALSKRGISCGRHRVARLMKLSNMASKTKKKFRVTTDSAHGLPIAENILARNFEVKNPNKVWVQDITYIWTGEGFMYLAVVIDLFSRTVVGWSMQDNMRKGLVIDALDMAVKARKPGKNLLIHSDRGSQYCSHLFQSKLKSYGMICSMSGKGECWDNAVAESFFHTLKTEYVYFEKFKTREEASLGVFKYLEVFYNRIRLHSSLGYSSPSEYEFQFLIVS